MSIEQELGNVQGRLDSLEKTVDKQYAQLRTDIQDITTSVEKLISQLPCGERGTEIAKKVSFRPLSWVAGIMIPIFIGVVGLTFDIASNADDRSLINEKQIEMLHKGDKHVDSNIGSDTGSYTSDYRSDR